MEPYAHADDLSINRGRNPEHRDNLFNKRAPNSNVSIICRKMIAVTSLKSPVPFVSH